MAAVAQNQPPKVPLPDINLFEKSSTDSVEKFSAVLSGIGGKVYHIDHLSGIASIITDMPGIQGRIVNLVPGVKVNNAEEILSDTNVHNLQDVDLAILKAHFGVAENGAVWITEELMGERALPFICQHLAVIIDAGTIVPTMHDAYELINCTTYDYGTFIAGPSKTADIEQSLVIGAHGPRSMTVFVLSDQKG